MQSSGERERERERENDRIIDVLYMGIIEGLKFH
jgi:hypothetical protein